MLTQYLFLETTHVLPLHDCFGLFLYDSWDRDGPLSLSLEIQQQSSVFLGTVTYQDIFILED